MSSKAQSILARHGIRLQQHQPSRNPLLRLLYRAQASVISVVTTAAFAYLIYR